MGKEVGGRGEEGGERRRERRRSEKGGGKDKQVRKIGRREGEGGVRGEDVSNQQNHTSAAVPTYLELTLIDVLMYTCCYTSTGCIVKQRWRALCPV